MTGNLLERYNQSQGRELPEETSACTCTQHFVLYSDIYLISHQDSMFFLQTDRKREDAMIRIHQQCRGAEQRNRKTLESLTKSGFAQCPFRAAETFPMIKSFICCVASGLSLIPGGKREHCYVLFVPNTKSSWEFSLADNKRTRVGVGGYTLLCKIHPWQRGELGDL